MRLKDPPKLPYYLSEHDRRASRVDVEVMNHYACPTPKAYEPTIMYVQTLYADTPVDASLLSLYIQQNYTLYCNTLDECDGVIDSLSWVDSSGGESVRTLPSLPPYRHNSPFIAHTDSTCKQTHTNFTLSLSERCTRSLRLSLERARNRTSLSFLRI